MTSSTTSCNLVLSRPLLLNTITYHKSCDHGYTDHKTTNYIILMMITCKKEHWKHVQHKTRPTFSMPMSIADSTSSPKDLAPLWGTSNPRVTVRPYVRWKHCEKHITIATQCNCVFTLQDIVIVISRDGSHWSQITRVITTSWVSTRHVFSHKGHNRKNLIRFKFNPWYLATRDIKDSNEVR